MGRLVKNPKLKEGTGVAQKTTASRRGKARNGTIIYNKTTSTLQVYIGSQWYNISSASAEKTLVVDKFQGDGSTTVFGNGSGNTLDGSTAATFSTSFDSATDVLVFVGGIAQIPSTNYSVSGNQITFGSPPPANDGTSNGHIITVVQNLQKLGE